MFSFLRSRHKQPAAAKPLAVSDDEYNIIRNGNATSQSKRKLQDSASPSLTSFTNLKKKSFSLPRKAASGTKRSKKQNGPASVIRKSSIGFPQTLNDINNEETQMRLNKAFRSPSNLDLKPLAPLSADSSNTSRGVGSSGSCEYGNDAFLSGNTSLLESDARLEAFKNPFTDFEARFNLTNTRNGQEAVNSTVLAAPDKGSSEFRNEPMSATSAIDSFAHNLNNRISKDLQNASTTTSSSPIKFNDNTQLHTHSHSVSHADELLHTYAQRTLDPLINIKRQANISLSSDNLRSTPFEHDYHLVQDQNKTQTQNQNQQQQQLHSKISSLSTTHPDHKSHNRTSSFSSTHHLNLSAKRSDTEYNSLITPKTSRTLESNNDGSSSHYGASKQYSPASHKDGLTKLDSIAAGAKFPQLWPRASVDFDKFVESGFNEELLYDNNNDTCKSRLEEAMMAKIEKFNMIHNEIKEKNSRLLKSPKSLMSLLVSDSKKGSLSSSTDIHSQNTKTNASDSVMGDIVSVTTNTATFKNKKVPESLLQVSKNDKYKLLPDLGTSPISIQFEEILKIADSYDDPLDNSEQPNKASGFAHLMKPSTKH